MYYIGTHTNQWKLDYKFSLKYFQSKAYIVFLYKNSMLAKISMKTYVFIRHQTGNISDVPKANIPIPSGFLKTYLFSKLVKSTTLQTRVFEAIPIAFQWLTIKHSHFGTQGMIYLPGEGLTSVLNRSVPLSSLYFILFF